MFASCLQDRSAAESDAIRRLVRMRGSESRSDVTPLLEGRASRQTSKSPSRSNRSVDDEEILLVDSEEVEQAAIATGATGGQRPVATQQPPLRVELLTAAGPTPRQEPKPLVRPRNMASVGAAAAAAQGARAAPKSAPVALTMPMPFGYIEREEAPPPPLPPKAVNEERKPTPAPRAPAAPPPVEPLSPTRTPAVAPPTEPKSPVVSLAPSSVEPAVTPKTPITPMSPLTSATPKTPVTPKTPATLNMETANGKESAGEKDDTLIVSCRVTLRPLSKPPSCQIAITNKLVFLSG